MGRAACGFFGATARASVKLSSEPLRWQLTDCLTATVAPVESFIVGTWLSLVEHSLGVRGVGSSNLPVPTNVFPLFLRFFASSLWFAGCIEEIRQYED
jgi:hypothetical protein